MTEAPDSNRRNALRTRFSGAGGGIILALLAGIVLGGSGLWAYQTVIQQDLRTDRLELALQDLSRSQESLRQMQTQFEVLRGQLVLEESTRKGLEKSLQSTQDDLARTREQLAFYEQLLPPGPSGSISIRALDVSQRGDLLGYKVLLQRNATEGKAFSGSLQFQATGRQDGKTVKIDLSPAVGPEPQAVQNTDETSDSLALNFNQFQRAMGWLALPAGFEPVSLTLNILEGNTIRVSRQAQIAQPD
ncbi:MAG TPA: hypothetical protein PLG97_06760 [Alcaligenes sp.]|nr:hypothetical protein [Alcaligenes sp.]HRL27202.1 hypothetical protein [Alcaligenes sp.]